MLTWLKLKRPWASAARICGQPFGHYHTIVFTRRMMTTPHDDNPCTMVKFPTSWCLVSKCPTPITVSNSNALNVKCPVKENVKWRAMKGGGVVLWVGWVVGGGMLMAQCDRCITSPLIIGVPYLHVPFIRRQSDADLLKCRSHHDAQHYPTLSPTGPQWQQMTLSDTCTTRLCYSSLGLTYNLHQFGRRQHERASIHEKPSNHSPGPYWCDGCGFWWVAERGFDCLLPRATRLSNAQDRVNNLIARVPSWFDV